MAGEEKLLLRMCLNIKGYEKLTLKSNMAASQLNLRSTLLDAMNKTIKNEENL